MPRSLRTLLAIALMAMPALLAGCQHAPTKPAPAPAVVHVVITRYAAIPALLTKPFAIPQRASNRILDVVDAYNRRGEVIQSCNSHLAAIQQLSDQAVPATPDSAEKPP